ncbi:MAG: hypothetical protein ACRC92_26480 [Peptostreptococcaceae bacterium]
MSNKILSVFKDASEVIVDALFELGSNHELSEKMGESVIELNKFVNRIELPRREEDENDYRRVPISDLLDMGIPRTYIEEHYSYIYHNTTEDDIINYVYSVVPEDRQPDVISMIVANRDEIRGCIEHQMNKDTPVNFENELFAEVLTTICGYEEE